MFYGKGGEETLQKWVAHTATFGRKLPCNFRLSCNVYKLGKDETLVVQQTCHGRCRKISLGPWHAGLSL